MCAHLCQLIYQVVTRSGFIGYQANGKASTLSTVWHHFPVFHLRVFCVFEQKRTTQQTKQSVCGSSLYCILYNLLAVILVEFRNKGFRINNLFRLLIKHYEAAQPRCICSYVIVAFPSQYYSADQGGSCTD